MASPKTQILNVGYPKKAMQVFLDAPTPVPFTMPHARYVDAPTGLSKMWTSGELVCPYTSFKMIAPIWLDGHPDYDDMKEGYWSVWVVCTEDMVAMLPINEEGQISEFSATAFKKEKGGILIETAMTSFTAKNSQLRNNPEWTDEGLAMLAMALSAVWHVQRPDIRREYKTFNSDRMQSTPMVRTGVAAPVVIDYSQHDKTSHRMRRSPDTICAHWVRGHTRKYPNGKIVHIPAHTRNWTGPEQALPKPPYLIQGEAH